MPYGRNWKGQEMDIRMSNYKYTYQQAYSFDHD